MHYAQATPAMTSKLREVLKRFVISTVLMFLLLSCFLLVPLRRPLATSKPLFHNNKTRHSQTPGIIKDLVRPRTDPLGDVTPVGDMSATPSFPSLPSKSRTTPPFYRLTESRARTGRFNVTDLDREFDFDEERDVLMFMQIQKTGSTELDLHLVYDAEVGQQRTKCR